MLVVWARCCRRRTARGLPVRARKVKEDWRGQTLMPHAPKKGRVEPEASVLDRVMRALEACPGVKVMRNRIGFDRRAMRHYGLGTGSSDVLCIVAPYGRALWIETKRGDGGKVSDEQEAWIEEQRALGCVADVCVTPEHALLLVVEARKPWAGAP